MNQKVENRKNVLLQKWLNGTITWQEERELEQLAKGDAMLADALAGFQSMPESNHTQQIALLKNRLKERTQRKQRGLIFYLPRVAAVAAVIATLAFGIRYFVDNAGVQSKVAVREEQATSREQQETIPPANAEPSIAILSEDSNQAMAFEDRKALANQNSNRENLLKPTSPAKENTRVEQFADTNFNSIETQAPAIAAEEKPALTQLDQAKTMSEPSQLQKLNAARSVAPSAHFLIERIIIGKLTNTKGEPLVGVVVSTDSKDSGTVTGLDGDFTLPVPAQTKELVFSPIGFQSTTVPIGKNDTVIVQLKESGEALSEVVVSGYNTQKQKVEARKEDSESIKKAEALSGKTQGVQTQSAPQPQPSVGLEKYKQYIEKNLRYPKAAREAGIEGEVAVAFQILPNGNLTEFKILKSLGYGCDEEAIRLLKQGPKWERANSSKAKEVAGYVVEFKLKK